MGELDALGQYQGWPLGVVPLLLASPQYSLIAQALRLDECLPVGDPIDGCVRLDESLRIFVSGLVLLHSGCERVPVAPGRLRFCPASHRVCASLWLPTH